MRQRLWGRQRRQKASGETGYIKQKSKSIEQISKNIEDNKES